MVRYLFACIENLSSYNFVFKLVLYCKSVFIYRKSSFLISCGLWKCWLQLYCLLIAFFHYSLRCPHRELFCSHKPTVLRFGLWLMRVAQGLVRFRKLTFIDLNVRRGLPYTAKGVILLWQANISLANIYIGFNNLWLEHINVDSTSTWDILSGIVRYHFAETLRNWKRLPYTSIVLALLEILTLERCLQSPCSVAFFFSRSNVST